MTAEYSQRLLRSGVQIPICSKLAALTSLSAHNVNDEFDRQGQSHTGKPSFWSKQAWGNFF